MNNQPEDSRTTEAQHPLAQAPGSASWTKTRPKISGFYWYRDEGCEPVVIEWDVEMQWVQKTGSDIMEGDDMMHGIDGEFWSERLSSPNDQGETRGPNA